MVVSAADLHAIETELLARRTAQLPAGVVGSKRSPAPARCSSCSACRASCRSSRTTTCCSSRTGRRGFTRSSGTTRRCRAGLPLHVQAERVGRGCRAAWARERVRAGAGARRPRARAAVTRRRWGSGLEKIADNDHRADRRVGGHPRPRRADRGAAHRRAGRLRRRARTPGAGPRSARLTRCGRARFPARQPAPQGRRGSTTPAARPSPGSGCRCA